MAKCNKMSPSEFHTRFGTEELCRQYVYKKRWPYGFICPKCGSRRCYFMSNGNMQCASCRSQASLTSDTIMHRSHLPLTKWFEAMYWVQRSDNKITAKRIQSELHVTYKTAWYLLSRIRRAIGKEEITYDCNGKIEFNEALFVTLPPEK